MQTKNLAALGVVAMGEALRVAANELRERMGASADDVAAALTQAASVSFIRIYAIGSIENLRTVVDGIEAELVAQAKASDDA